jgi:hypothetical protein
MPGRLRGERKFPMHSTKTREAAPGLGSTCKRRNCLRGAWVLLACVYAAAGQAAAAQEQSWPQVWINPGIYSQHFDSSKGLRNNNIGFGIEARLAQDHVVMAGSFINSNRARTHFAGYEWRPLHWRVSGVDVGAGIVVGAFDGYPNYRNGAWFVAPLPLLSIEGRRLGANIALIPTVANRFDGALAVQIKLRVW